MNSGGDSLDLSGLPRSATRPTGAYLDAAIILGSMIIGVVIAFNAQTVAYRSQPIEAVIALAAMVALSWRFILLPKHIFLAYAKAYAAVLQHIGFTVEPVSWERQVARVAAKGLLEGRETNIESIRDGSWRKGVREDPSIFSVSSVCPKAWPIVRISRRSAFDTLVGAAKWSPFKTGDEDFDRKVRVLTKDPQFALAALTPAAKRLLLTLKRDESVVLAGGRLHWTTQRVIEPRDIVSPMRLVRDLISELSPRLDDWVTDPALNWSPLDRPEGPIEPGPRPNFLHKLKAPS